MAAAEGPRGRGEMHSADRPGSSAATPVIPSRTFGCHTLTARPMSGLSVLTHTKELSNVDIVSERCDLPDPYQSNGRRADRVSRETGWPPAWKGDPGGATAL